MERKKILIPGGKYSDLALVNAAHRLGLYVITAGTHTHAPAHSFADEYACVDYSDKEAMLQLAKDKKIDYMCTCANDFGMLSTAYVCEKLGLPGHDSYETTLTIHNKDRFKPLAKKLGLHTPISEVFTDKEAALQHALNSKNKIIVKPVDNVASIGVSQPNTPEEMEAAIDLAFEKSKIKTILIEPFIEGFFTTVTSMIINQEVVAFFADSAFFYPEGEVLGDEFPMNLRCNGGMQPAPYMDEWVPYIIEDFNKIAKELKLVDGKFHAEILIAPDHSAQIFDVHRRMSGFGEPMPEWDYSTSLMWEDWIVKAECGMDLSDFPKGVKQDRFYHDRLVYAPRNGKLKKMVFDDYLSARIVPEGQFQTNVVRNQKNFTIENVELTDHIHQPLTHVKLRFATLKEAEEMSDFNTDHFYKHVTFEYED
ncbi:MAG: hypothetical protein IJ508_04265 [Oscillospiraceae bacterium]|nr:hypothetical protein [Oscillospiraceae bacterium]